MNKKSLVISVLLIAAVMLFSGCAVITNIFNPLPEEYTEGVKYSRDYPDDDLEIYDDAIVFEEDEDEDEIMIKFGTMDDFDDVMDFYLDLFDDNELTVVESDEGRDDYYAEGRGDGFKFELTIEEARGEYEERAFVTVVEIVILPYEMGEEVLGKLQGFWFVCGIDADISDEYRSAGRAIDFHGQMMDYYEYFEADTADNEFTFVDDDTIKTIEDGEEYVIDITFENIDGATYLVMENEGTKVYLEKTTYDDMVALKDVLAPGARLLSKMQGFWLICGLDGDISDDYRIYGQAIEFYGQMMDFYDNFESSTLGNEFIFLDEDTINYVEEGTEYTVDVSFETLNGIEYLVMSINGRAIYLEQSSYDEMMSYQGLYSDGVIYLDDYLSDAELEYYISDLNWYLGYIYYYTENTFEETSEYVMLYFDSYYSGWIDYSEDSYDLTWYIYDSIMYVDYSDGTYEEFLVDYEFDGTYGYLYLFDVEMGYDDFAMVFLAG